MLTKYASSKLTNHLLGKASFTMPTNVYLVLFTADPTTTGAFTNEVPASRGYARQAMTAVMATATAGGYSVSGSDVTLGLCTTADWGEITHIGLADSSTLGAGNLLTYQALAVDQKRTIKLGDTWGLPSGTFKELIGPP